MVVLRARLTPEVGAVVLRALEAALEQVPASSGGCRRLCDEASIAQRRADALGLVAESALAGGLDPGSTGDRFQVTVHVEAEGLSCREVAAVPRHVSAEIAPGNEAALEPAAASLDGVADHVSSEHADDLPGTAATHDRDLVSTDAWPRRRAGGDRTGRRSPRWQAGRAPRRLRCRPRGGAPRRRWRRCSTWAAGPAPSRPRCVVPCRAGIVASVSSPAAPRATATPITSCIGPTEGRRSFPTWFSSADSITARCTRRGFRWSLTAPGGSSFCALNGSAAAGGATGGALGGCRAAAGADRGAPEGSRHQHRSAHRYSRSGMANR